MEARQASESGRWQGLPYLGQLRGTVVVPASGAQAMTLPSIHATHAATPAGDPSLRPLSRGPGVSIRTAPSTEAAPKERVISELQISVPKSLFPASAGFGVSAAVPYSTLSAAPSRRPSDDSMVRASGAGGLVIGAGVFGGEDVAAPATDAGVTQSGGRPSSAAAAAGGGAGGWAAAGGRAGGPRAGAVTGAGPAARPDSAQARVWAAMARMTTDAQLAVAAAGIAVAPGATLASAGHPSLRAGSDVVAADGVASSTSASTSISSPHDGGGGDSKRTRAFFELATSAQALGLLVPAAVAQRSTQEQVKEYVRDVTRAMQRRICAGLGAAEREERERLQGLRSKVREVLRWYHDKEGEIYELCKRLGDADAVVAYLRQEQAALKQELRARGVNVAEMEEREREASAALLAQAQDEAAAERAAAERLQQRGAGEGGDAGEGGESQEGNTGAGVDDVAGAASSAAEAAAGAAAGAAGAAEAGAGDDDLSLEQQEPTDRRPVAMRAVAARLKALLGGKVKELSELRATLMSRKAALRRAQLEAEALVQTERQRVRAALEGLIDEAKDVQLAREARQASLGEMRERLRLAVERRSALSDQLLDMGAVEDEMKELIARKHEDTRALTSRRAVLQVESEKSLQATEDAFLAACQKRAALVETVAREFSLFRDAVREATACCVCSGQLAQPITIIETGETCCRDCLPKYKKKSAVERLRLERAGLLGPKALPTSSAGGAGGAGAGAGGGGGDDYGVGGRSDPGEFNVQKLEADLLAAIAPQPLGVRDEPWLDSYLKQAPPGDWTSAQGPFRPHIPQVQLDPRSGLFQQRVAQYEGQVQDMLTRCQLTPAILRSFLSNRSKARPKSLNGSGTAVGSGRMSD